MRNLVISVLWASTLATLFIFYSDIVVYIIKTVPGAFVIVSPFGFSLFFGFLLAWITSFFAAREIGWHDLTVTRLTKLLVILYCIAVLLHFVLVLFVIQRGGL